MKPRYLSYITAVAGLALAHVGAVRLVERWRIGRYDALEERTRPLHDLLPIGEVQPFHYT